MVQRKVGVLVGSLRKESYSKKIAAELMVLAPKQLKMELIDISGLVLYNQDFDEDGNPPKAWVGFRELVKSFDAVLFVTPEYNRSVPAVLKNAIDIGSRPYGKSAWNGKPGAVVSVSTGAISGFGANHHLRQSLVFLNIPAMPQPEGYIGNAAGLFDENGSLINEKTREFLKNFIKAFAAWVETILDK
jgi:chromate reductase, NAD(P)H dehydrogenase (quinone)